jgi:hypothetical protein
MAVTSERSRPGTLRFAAARKTLHYAVISR